MKMYEKKLKSIISETPIIGYLHALHKAEMPNAWIMAGTIRNTVWKSLYPDSSLEVNDIDVPYFSNDLSIEMNEIFRKKLELILPTGKWECDNQAYVHTYLPREKYHMPNAPYNSLEESISDWWYSVNTIGVRLDPTKTNPTRADIQTLNPQPDALPDLFNGILRILPAQKNNSTPWFKKKVTKVTDRCKQIKVIW